MVNKKVNLKNVKMWATNFRVNTQTFSAYILKLTGFYMESFFPIQSHIFRNWKTIKLSSAKIVGTKLIF